MSAVSPVRRWSSVPRPGGRRWAGGVGCAGKPEVCVCLPRLVSETPLTNSDALKSITLKSSTLESVTLSPWGLCQAPRAVQLHSHMLQLCVSCISWSCGAALQLLELWGISSRQEPWQGCPSREVAFLSCRRVQASQIQGISHSIKLCSSTPEGGGGVWQPEELQQDLPPAALGAFCPQ